MFVVIEHDGLVRMSASALEALVCVCVCVVGGGGGGGGGLPRKGEIKP